MRWSAARDVAGLADGDPDGLVAGEAGEQELVVALAEELREARQDAHGVGVPVGLHHLLDHAEEVGHDLLLAVPQRLVLEEEEADGEAVLELLHAEQGVDGLAHHRREQRERRAQQLVLGRRLERLLAGRHAAPGEKAELLGDGAGVGEALSLRERPGGHVEVLADAAVAGGEHLAVQREEAGRQQRPLRRALHEIAHQRVALEEGGLVLGQQLRERAGETLERAVVLVRVPAAQQVGGPAEQRAQEQRELVRGEPRLEQPDDQLREQAEELLAVLGALEVRPVAQEGRLEAVDQQLGVAERVEVLPHGLRQGGAHTVQPGDRVEQRQVPVGDDDFLRGVREVGAERLGVEG